MSISWLSSKLVLLSELEVRRLPDGRRKLISDLIVELDGERIVIPAGFETDYSSWPRMLPGPSYEKIDIAGIVHDYLFKHKILGFEGREVGYVEANRIWYRIAIAGEGEARCNVLWALLGRGGLFVGSWPVWLKYRREDK